MTYNDLNSRVNLQAFCEANGVKDQTFLKIPRFGWFAKGPDGRVRSLVDFIPIEQTVQFCTDLILEKNQYHDGRLYYNEIAVTRLCNDIRIQLTLRRMHDEAVAEFNDGKATVGGRTTKLAKVYADNGMGCIARTGVGFLSAGLFAKYRTPLNLDPNWSNKLLIPTWLTPQHTASFEISQPDNPINNRRTIFLNAEKGWYGQPEDCVVGNFEQLLTRPGCTWDPKLNYWVTKPLQLDESLSVKQLVDVWAESQGLKFKQDPLDVIAKLNGVDRLKNNLGRLTLVQLSELEKRFGIKLRGSWESQKRREVTLSGFTYIARDQRYYVETNEGLEEVTNFAMEINSIEKRADGRYWRFGTIYYHGREEPFALPNDCFLSVGPFLSRLTSFFFDQGLGVPIISHKHKQRLLEVIERLNHDNIILPKR